MKNNLIRLLGKKQAEENRVISVTEIWRETGISRNTLNEWKQQRARRYDERTIVELCNFLDCEVGDLLYLERGERKPSATDGTLN